MPDALPSRRARRVVLGLLVVAFVVGAFWAWRSGVVSTSAIRDWLASLGPLAPILFVVAFVGGSMIGLPGMAFVVGARLAFGPVAGFALGYGAGVLACTVPFLGARWIRKAAPTEWRPKHRLAARAFELLQTHPLRAVIALRMVLWFNPPLSYALAFSSVPTRAYVLGCAIGLAPVVATAVLATGWFL